MQPSNTASFPRTLRMRMRRIPFEIWILIFGISVTVGIGTTKLLDAQKLDQYRAERAPIPAKEIARVEASFKAWSAITPALSLDRNNPSVLRWDGGSSKLIGIEHLQSETVHALLDETKHWPDRWVVYAQSQSGRLFSLVATWSYEKQEPVFDKAPRALTQVEMTRVAIRMNWIEQMRSIGVLVEDA
jgi:hypothetical protein